ncbi:ABC transporter ATP-binding protein [Arcanobacterium hippocoleae]
MSLQVNRLSLSYRTKILSDISFKIADGEILGIIGPSGSGKTSLLNAIAGLVQPDSGEIYIDGTPVTRVRTDRRKVGFAFQNPALFDLSVRENVEFGIDDPQIPAPRRTQLSDIMMAAMNLIGLADRPADTLSGGQAQRVSLARTLAAEPRVLLLDEPLAHIESAVRQNIHTDLLSQIKRFGISTIYVTHDLPDACAAADRIAVMDKGRILQIGTAEDLFFHPNSLAVAAMMGVPNSFAVAAKPAGQAGCVHAELGRAVHLFPAETDFSGAGIAFITPNNIALTRSKNSTVFGLSGKILRRTFARSHWVYQIETEFGTVVSWQLQSFQPHEYVDLTLLSGWVIPA